MLSCFALSSFPVSGVHTLLSHTSATPKSEKEKCLHLKCYNPPKMIFVSCLVLFQWTQFYNFLIKLQTDKKKENVHLLKSMCTYSICTRHLYCITASVWLAWRQPTSRIAEVLWRPRLLWYLLSAINWTLLSQLFTVSHRFNMWFRSGELSGQSSTIISASRRKHEVGDSLCWERSLKGQDESRPKTMTLHPS